MQLHEYTMADYIDAIGNENITMKNLQYQDITEVNNNFLILNTESVLRMYKNDLRVNVATVRFDNKQKRKYFYRPWLFCLDTFGISDLWRDLLDLNQIRSFSEFDHETIKVFSPDIVAKMKVVLKMEQDIIDEKSSTLLEKIKEATLA